jgi:3D (Asp-Asp-Asp) domain-containing protein
LSPLTSRRVDDPTHYRVTPMNGFVAQSAQLTHLAVRNLRTLLLVICCAMSLALLGAVRARSIARPEPMVALALSEASVPVPPGKTDDKTPLGALNEPEQRSLEIPAQPAGLELLHPTLFALTPTPVPTLAAPKVRQILMEVTAYCACKKCCGPRAQGLTASGRRIDYNGGRFVAADTRLLKFNTKLLVPGYAAGQPVEVIDRGGAIKGNKLDVFFDSHDQARKWGRQWLLVTVLE